MQIPSLLYGEYGDVSKRCRRAIKHYARGKQPFWDILAAEGMSDTAEHPDPIAVEGPHRANDGSVFYHCDAPLYLMMDISMSPDMEEDIFTAGMEAPWSLLCMLTRETMYRWFARHDLEHVRPERFRRYVFAVLRHWDALDAEGARYAGNRGDRERLWTVAGTLKYVLANLGVPGDMLRHPLPSGGLYALLAQADPAKAGDLVDLGKANQASWRSPAGDVDEDERPSVSPPPSFNVFASAAMSMAMSADDQATVRRLVEAGESIAAIDMDTLQSPLLWAAWRGHTDLARFLLDHGADIEDKADEGESPLMLAAFEGHLDTVRLLLDRGANPAYRTDKGWDAMMFAELGKHDDVAAVLKAVQGSA